MSVESLKYEVLKHDGHFELRRYEGYLTANVKIRASSYTEATNDGFGPLADYIFGNNKVSGHISMTAPVTAARDQSQKIAMTTPVSTRKSEDQYVVSFTMPSTYSLEELPLPNNPMVTLEEVAPHLAAAVSFHGYFGDKSFAEGHAALEKWILEQGLTPAGETVAAHYDAPWTPGFMRHNEILIPVS